MSDKRIRRPDDGPRSDGNTEETVRYPATLRPPGVHEGDLVPPHMTTAPTPVPEAPVRLNKTKLGLGAAAPGGTFFAHEASRSAPPSSDAVTRVQPAPAAARSAFAKPPSAAPPSGDAGADDDERLMNSHGLVEPWLAPSPSDGPFRAAPSTRPPAQPVAPPRAVPVRAPEGPVPERSRLQTQLGLGPSKPPPPPGRASAAPRPASPARAERVFAPPENKSMQPTHAAPPRTQAPTERRGASATPAAQTPAPERAPSRAASPSERAISRPLPPLASAPVAPPRPPAQRAPSDVRLALHAQDAIDGAARSQRPVALPRQRRSGLTWALLASVVVSLAALGWLTRTDSAPAASPTPQPSTPVVAAPQQAEPATTQEAPEVEAPAATVEPAHEPKAPVEKAQPQAPAPEATAAPKPAVEAPAKAEPARRTRREREPTPPSEDREDILQARDALRALSEGKAASQPVLTIEPADEDANTTGPSARPEAPDTHAEEPAPVLRFSPAPEPGSDALDDE